MKLLNVILLFNENETKILMCKREKEPYKGKFNLVGGKVEIGEDEEDAAYRELFEETGISRNDIKLYSLIDFIYPIADVKLSCYAGKLKGEVSLIEEVNKLYWMDVNEDFFDLEKFAGEGNIGHMVHQYHIYKEKMN